MFRQKDECALRLHQIRFYKGKTKDLLGLGLPAGIQNAIFSIANLFIQSGVNSFDSTMVAGNSAAANADSVI